MRRFANFAFCLVVLSTVVLLPLALADAQTPATSSAETNGVPASGEPVSDLRVMSFNIRFGAAPDGDNHWDHRQENVITTIEDFSPDLLATQEVLLFQVRFLKEQLDEFTFVGRSREKQAFGEHCGILFRTKRFDMLEQGHFWLSETPNVPGSKSWDSAVSRMATWVKLFDRQTETAIYFLNTHFDHRGVEARHNAAKLILERVQQFEPDVPVIFAGDLNAAPSSKPVLEIVDVLTDSFAALHPKEKGQGTFNGFRGLTNGARIDYIFASNSLQPISAAIDRHEFDGKTPSDHFPVTAVLRFADPQDTQN